MYKILFTVIVLFLLNACGGGGGGSTTGGGGGVVATPTVSGTAATGVALEGIVNVYGSNGGSVTDVPIDASGNYSADVSGLEPPFFLCAVPTNNMLASQYSWADGPGTANITPMTTLALFYANGDQDPAPLVGTWPANQAAVTTNLPNSQAAVNANFVGIFAAINAALNIDFATYDFFSAGFNIGDILDQILDLLGVDLSSGTPVITVNGAAFTFDPSIDISGIDIGGSGGGGGGSTGLGSLTISGVDTSAIGTSFTPTIQTGSANTIIAIVWGAINGAQISIGGSNGQLTVITFNNAQVIGGQVVVYSYALTCVLPGNDCSNLQFDATNKQAVFNNLQMPLSGAANNAAMGPITLNGTLNWE